MPLPKMKKICTNPWKTFDKITYEEAIENAFADPDAQPFTAGARVELRKEDGSTVPERFRKAILREQQHKVDTIEKQKPE